MQVIDTVLGPRQKASCGEVGVPTYYGLFRRGDKAALIRAGYSRNLVRKASGIRANGSLISWSGDFYKEGIPMNQQTINFIRNNSPEICR